MPPLFSVGTWKHCCSETLEGRALGDKSRYSRTNMLNRRNLLRAVFAGAVPSSLLLGQDKPKCTPDVPYVPTTEPAVEAMLKLAGVKKTDVVYDLGCGDGRIVVTAAKAYGARGVGIDYIGSCRGW